MTKRLVVLFALAVGVGVAFAETAPGGAPNTGVPMMGVNDLNRARYIRTDDAGRPQVVLLCTNPSGQTVPCQSTDSGYLQTAPADSWAGNFGRPTTTCTSTGAAAWTWIPAGKYWQVQCTTAAYFGDANTLNADAGPAANVPAVGSSDGGAIPTGTQRAAGEVFYLDLTTPANVTANAVGCMANNGTTNCVMKYQVK